jgi:membrane fusion protein, copper/silver efflux system
MKKKLRNSSEVESLKLRVQSKINSFDIKPLTVNLLVTSIIACFIIACSSGDSGHNHADTYICPMHPTVVSDKPGVCPVCGMDLVRKARPGEEVKITDDLAKLIKSPNEVVLASVKTMKAEYKSLPVSLTVQGVITYDTRNIFTIAARVGGRLEKVFLKYNYQPVREGQKVAEIYSVELVNAQREFLYLLRNDAENKLLIDAAKSKLLLLGATEKQIDEVASKQEVSYTFSIYSPYKGYVISENQSAPSAPANGMAKTSSASAGMGMGGSAEATVSSSTVVIPSSTSSFVREGSYVAAGQTLFRIVNTNSLWIEFNIPLQQASQVKTGDILTWLDKGTNKQLKVDFVEPFFAAGEDFIRIRSYYRGDDVSVGQLVEGSIQRESNETFWLPKAAVLDLGLDQILFRKERGLFKPVKVKTGLQTDEWIEIKSGLTSSDEVAVNAQYLIDSENFIKTSN